MRRSAESGFTLLEVLMVLALLGVLIAFAWPDFAAVSAGERLKDSAQQMRALIAMCRAEAMNETVNYRIKIRLDGGVRVLRQADALNAPQLYITPRSGWAHQAVLLEDVWVEAVQDLPEGPPPIQIIDEKLEFPEMVVDPQRIDERAQPVEINFAPNGDCDSLRWVLRDARGQGLLMTLDGRLGRVAIADWAALPRADLRRPERLPEEEEVKYSAEDYQTEHRR